VPGWPFVARSEELHRASQALEADSGFHGVVLVGDAGVGKTTLARALAEMLESRGYSARFVLGTQTGKAVPLGAFHRIVPMPDAHEPAVMLGAVHRALASQGELVVVVDDAQHLDTLSALVVQQLAMSSTTPLIVTIRSGEVVSDAVTALWKDELLRRLDIAPFARRQTDELVNTVLTGDVDQRLVDELHQRAAGSPLVLRSLLTVALEDEIVVRDNNSWRLRGSLRLGADLGELFQSQLDALSPEELDAVEIVATAEVLDWQILRLLCAQDAITRAERRGAIQFVKDRGHTLAQPGHPVLGEIVRQRCGVIRSRQINSLLAQRLSAFLRAQEQSEDAGRPDVPTLIQLAQFMMRSDEPPDLQVMTRAAESAVTMSNLVLGEQLARFAFDRGGGLNAALPLADAISWQGRGAQAEDLLAQFDPDGADQLMTARWGCLRAANLFFGCGRPGPAATVLATVRDRVASEPMLGLVTAMEVSFAFFGADMPTAITMGTAALGAPMMPMATVWATMATAGALALVGQFTEVAATAQQGLQAATQCESGPQRYAIGLAEVLGLTGAGQLAEAERVCDRYSAMTAGVPQAEAIVTALVGQVKLAGGLIPAACAALQESLWTMSESLPPGWVMLVASWLAQAEAVRGNTEGAAAARIRAEQTNGPQVRVFLPELELAKAWEHAAVGETTAGQRHALRAAQIAALGGMHAVEMRALHTALRLGDRMGHTRLQRLAGKLGSPMAAAIDAHSRGLADHNGDRLDDAADQFGQIGALALAADATAHAAREHARAGNRIKELESSTRAHWLASQCGLVTPALSSVKDPLPITDREREIANLVGAGLTNREIADRLRVSVRTVDGHLYRIFAKLRIEDRDQLARLIQARPAT
jgi:DNA-binding CsgD family transcriptional regulator